MQHISKVKFRLIFLCSITLSLLLFGCAGDVDQLYSIFQDPPTEAKPFVRWWWNGDRVNEEEILRELDVMHEAGIGGVEINPIAMPAAAKDIGAKALQWLSPEWNRMVEAAADGAHQREMISDMIVGTGWPFGGRFLPPEEQIKGVVLQKLPVEGPTIFENQVQELIERKQTPEAEEVPEPELLFLRLVPQELDGLDQVQDLTDQVASDGTVRFEVPAGEHTLYLGSIQRGIGFREVTLGAPGADGPCLDHYNVSAVRRYIQRVSDSLGPELGGKLGDALRALFVDSIELSGSNWTQDLPAEFRSRRGYDLEPYYQFVFYEDPHDGYQDEFAAGEDLADTIKRVRYDYNLTLVELFLERFTETYHQWCNEQNTQSRYQAYGTPWLMGMSEGYLIPDIPESNNWLFSPDPYSHGYYVWNKYTSAGAHLTGRSIASCEAMTNTSGVFKTTLNMIKQADDMNFIMGINHSVLHGFNYSPPEAGFPGWVRFGAYFSEQNTWWPYFRNWADYNARLSAIFQAADPQVGIGVLVPRSDLWSTTGLARVQIHTKPWYGHRMWEAIHQDGASADYLSETVIQNAEAVQGALQYGPMAYNTLILTNVRTLEAETAEALLQFVNVGGKLIFVESQPNRSASFSNAGDNDERVRDAVAEILQNHPDRARVVDPPAGMSDLLPWTRGILDKFQVARDVRISTPNPSVYQIHSTWGDKDIFFFNNYDEQQTIRFEAQFQTGEKTPWIWDPHTGERQVYPYGDSRSELSIHLRPLESLLLVFEPDLTGTPQEFSRVDANQYVRIAGPWECEFQHAREDDFQWTMTELVNFGQSPDSRLNTFAGTVLYRTTFEVDSAQPSFLDLGEVHGVSEVTLNGTQLGISWWGKHLYDVSDALQNGTNQLEVKVTTVLHNYVRSMTDNATARQWTDADETVDAGMVGPVHLYRKIAE